jgi:hypothetical protein
LSNSGHKEIVVGVGVGVGVGVAFTLWKHQLLPYFWFAQSILELKAH